jgi:Flp pilus assembly protein TadG
MSSIRGWSSDEEGVAAIEGAIVLLAFIFLLFTLMEFLYVMFAYNTVVRAAENAARYAMFHSANGCVAGFITNVENAGEVVAIPVQISVVDCEPGGATTTINCSTTGTTALPGTIIVQAEYDFESAGFFLSVLGSRLPIEATVCVPLINFAFQGNPV